MLIVNFEICKTKNESTRIPSARVSQDPKPNIQQAHPGGILSSPLRGKNYRRSLLPLGAQDGKPISLLLKVSIRVCVKRYVGK